MANRVSDFGMDVALHRKATVAQINSKYDPDSEREAIGWVSQLTGQQINLGRENVFKFLKNGQILVKLVDVVYERTPNLPPRAQMVKRPIKANSMNAPFKQ
ncbi:Calponin-3, partial [Cichlidogyrus casuarinus]